MSLKTVAPLASNWRAKSVVSITYIRKFCRFPGLDRQIFNQYGGATGDIRPYSGPRWPPAERAAFFFCAQKVEYATLRPSRPDDSYWNLTGDSD